MIRTGWPLILAVAVAAAGCRAPEPEDAPEPGGSTKTRPAKQPPVVRKGRIEGFVRYEGELPPPLPVEMSGPRATACAAAKGVYELSVVRGPEGGLANALVSVEGVPADKRPARSASTSQTRTIAIDGCVVKPYVIDATLEDTLEIRNEDDHVYLCNLSGSPDAMLKRGILPGQSMTWSLATPGFSRISCTTDHPWLFGHLAVVQHPWHAVTTASGRFTIEDVPVGSYTVQAWHPTQRLASSRVEVRADGVTQVEIVYRARPTKAPAKTAPRR